MLIGCNLILADDIRSQKLCVQIVVTLSKEIAIRPNIKGPLPLIFTRKIKFQRILGILRGNRAIRNEIYIICSSEILILLTEYNGLYNGGEFFYILEFIL